MSTSSFSSSRCRLVATVLSALAVLALAAALIALVAGAGVPDSWWPRAGQVFSADSRSGSARQDLCGPLVDPAKEYCGRGPNSTASLTAEAPRLGSRAGWMVVAPAAGLAAAARRCRGAAGHGRH